MEHLNITFPEDLREALDRQAEREGTKRSTLIQKAVVVYLKLKRKNQLNQLLREGYQEMAGESKELAEEFKHMDRESLKDVD